MNQGTVFRRLDNPEYPYFVIAQSDQLIDLNTRVIIPFVRWRPSLLLPTVRKWVFRNLGGVV